MDSETGVGADLAELRRTSRISIPASSGNLLAPKKLFGIIPFGNKLRNYFDGYKSAQSHIASILARLAGGKDELLKDNAAIDVERQKLWAAMGRLEQMIHVSKALDAKLEAKALELEATDPAKAKAIRETALFYVRQRTPGPADADGGHGAGLSRARPGQEEQRRAGEGRRPRLDHHRRARCAPRSPWRRR